MNRFIFDLDGTIVNTQTPFHARAEAELLLLHHNVSISPEELSERFAGISTRQVFKELVPDCDPDLLVKAKWEKMYALAEHTGITCLPEMYELIHSLSHLRHSVSIASASPIKWIELCLKKASPHNFFHYDKSLAAMFHGRYFSAEDCVNPKPAPDVFLKAYTDVQDYVSDLDHTYVIGDGRADVVAGLAAGMPVLYLSEDNKEFDTHSRVKRFASSEELSYFVRQHLTLK